MVDGHGVLKIYFKDLNQQPGLDKTKTRNLNSFQLSLMICQGSGTWPSSAAYPGASARSWLKSSSWDSNYRPDMECRWLLKCRCNPVPGLNGTLQDKLSWKSSEIQARERVNCSDSPPESQSPFLESRAPGYTKRWKHNPIVVL